MMLGEGEGLKGCAERTGKPGFGPTPSPSPSVWLTYRFAHGGARLPGCHLYFARGVTFLTCADNTLG
jgi:hypothetical protein